MKYQGILAQGLVVIALVAGCSSGSDAPASPSAAAPSTSTSAPPPAAPSAEPSSEPSETPTKAEERDAAALAEAMEAAVDRIVKIEVYTEDNDPNELIGRPGQYTSAAVLADKDGDGDSGIDRGAVIEVFANAEDAKARSKYILDILKEASWLGTEWHHLSDTALLRVSGTLKPSVNKVYEQAWTDIAG